MKIFLRGTFCTLLKLCNSLLPIVPHCRSINIPVYIPVWHEILAGAIFSIFSEDWRIIIIWRTNLEWLLHEHTIILVGIQFGCFLMHPPIRQINFSANISCHTVFFGKRFYAWMYVHEHFYCTNILYIYNYIIYNIIIYIHNYIVFILCIGNVLKFQICIIHVYFLCRCLQTVTGCICYSSPDYRQRRCIL